MSIFSLKLSAKCNPMGLDSGIKAVSNKNTVTPNEAGVPMQPVDSSKGHFLPLSASTEQRVSERERGNTSFIY